MPLDSDEDISEFKTLSRNIGISTDNPCYADLLNMRAAFRSRENCQTCKAIKKFYCSKVEVYKDGSRIKARQIPCNKVAAVQSIDVSSIPKKFAGIRAKNWLMNDKNKSATIAATDAVEKNHGLYLFGDVGTGKTMLCSIIAIERAYKGKSSLFYTVTDLLEDLRDFDNPLKRAEKLHKVKSCPCLIVDDLGAEYVTDWVIATLFSILDARYKSNLQTVINSNFSLDGLKSRYKGYNGERLVRRINELCAIVKIGGAQ